MENEINFKLCLSLTYFMLASSTGEAHYFLKASKLLREFKAELRPKTELRLVG